ncbi:hypothetical protein HGA92_00575 [Candidatus Gracilibacteria bacterium]|nr:hypothetical protein [Candidatus Gracilibacteria bacterium]NUJ98896.1 hypothetical protein [Candidatus Gracilibacteria bacterium]
MKIYKSKFGFTFVELIVISSILVILATIGFYSYSKHINTSRDTKRKEVISSLKSDLEIYKKEKGAFPKPGDAFMLQNESELVAFQGKFNEGVFKKYPLDPLLKIPYLYGVSKNRGEFQLAGTLENNGSPTSIVEGNYSSVAKYTLPSLLIAYEGNGAINIATEPYRNMFILNNAKANIPYSFDTKKPQSLTGTLLSSLLDNPTTKLWQNTDYTNCEEICKAGKYIGQGTYQILSSTGGGLIDTNCAFSAGCDAIEFTAGYSCGLTPSYSNATFTAGSPTMHNQLWQNTNTTAPCYFTCNTNYTWNGGTNTCDPATQQANCSGTIPTYATATTGTGFTQTWNGGSWIPSSMTWGENKTECDFDCDTNYTWEGSACIASTQTGTCTGLPTTNASWNTVSSITQTWNGSTWTPSTTGTYNASASTSECRFKCTTGYTWNGSSCVNLACIFGTGVFGICIF